MNLNHAQAQIGEPVVYSDADEHFNGVIVGTHNGLVLVVFAPGEPAHPCYPEHLATASPQTIAS